MSRRGEVKRASNGTWFFVVDVAPVGAPRRQLRRRGFLTKRAAQEELNELLADAQRGTFTRPQRLTLAGYLREWLIGIEAAGRRPTTIGSYRWLIEKHVIPRIGHVQVQQLDAVTLDRMYAELLSSGRDNPKKDGSKGLSPRTVRYLHTVLGKALSDAERKGIVQRNVARLADPPSASSARSPEMDVWSPAETSQFLEFVKTQSGYERYAALFRLSAMTGMRRGEVCGLRWSDVELDAGLVSVRQQRATIGETVVVGEVKTARSRRMLDIDPVTAVVLRSHRLHQAQERLLLGSGWHDTGYVFTDPQGDPLHPNVVSKVFQRLVDRSELPRIRLHDLRDGHATHLLAAGVNVKVVSERLGHASTSFTLDVYAHVLPGQQADAAAAAASLVDAAVTIL